MTADDRRGAGGYDIEPRRSVFASLWFRVLLVVIVIGVAGVLAVPYVLDVMNPPPPKPVAGGQPASPALPLPAPAPAPESSAQPPAAPGASTAAPPVAGRVPTEEKQAERPKTTQPEKQPARRTAKASAPSAATGSGAYWVQVGAFKNAEAAKRLAARLREQHYPVAESSTGAGERRTAGRAPSARPASGGAASDKYDVFVGGGSPEDITVKLSAKGLSTAPARDGVVVKPSLPLRDAIALSKDLAAEGLKVQVRRSGAPASATAAPAGNTGGEMLYRVRVGPYPDRAAATSARKELEEKGYKPFIARR